MKEFELFKKINKSYYQLGLNYFRLFFSFFLMLLTALLEMLGLSMLYPLMLTLGGNSIADSTANNFLTKIIPFNLDMAIFFRVEKLFIFFAFIFAFKNMVLFLAYRYNIGFATYFYQNFVKGIYTVYLKQPILKLQANSVGYLTDIICVETRKLIDGIVRPSFVLLTELLIMLSISLVALCISPIAICLVLSTCSVCVILYYGFLRVSALTWGKKELLASAELQEFVQNTARGISEIKMFSRNNRLILKLEEIVLNKVNMFRYLEMYQQTPRYIIETVFIVTIMVYCATCVHKGADSSVLLAEFSIIVAAAFRILPSINRIVGSYSNISFHLCPAIALMDIVNENSTHDGFKNRNKKSATCKLKFNSFSKIEIRNLSFKYSGSGKNIINNFNLDIVAYKKIGISGFSGCGKSTFIKILAGLYRQNKGTILLDGVNDIYHDINQWRKIVAYVSQEAFIMPGSVRENISFEDTEEKDDNIWDSLKKVGLYNFFKKLPNCLDTVIGETGIKLSGGQRQLICLARALYSEPTLLLLDEPTSSLDVDSEKIVLDVINTISDNTTILMISHKPENFDSFDYVIEFKSSGELN